MPILTNKYIYTFVSEYVEKGMVDIYEDLDENVLAGLIESIENDGRFFVIRSCIENVLIGKRKMK
jgi:hypothetical protein